MTVITKGWANLRLSTAVRPRANPGPICVDSVGCWDGLVSHKRILLTLLSVLALLAAGPALFLILLGLFPQLQLRHTLLTQLASFIHLGLILWVLAALLIAPVARWARRRVIPGLALLLVLAGLTIQLTWILPFYRANPEPTADGGVQIAMINIAAGQGNPDELLRQTAGSDVLVIIEASTASEQALIERGLRRTHPHRVGSGTAVGVDGATIWSRYPLTDLGSAPTLFESRLVRVDTPDAPLVVAGVHPVNPMGGTALWQADAAAIRAWIAPHLAERTVVIGDFNAIDRHHPMQLLYADGWRDAADLTGSGLHPTWPVGRHGLPPLIGIDHALLSPSVTATSMEWFRVPGADHVGLRVRVG